MFRSFVLFIHSFVHLTHTYQVHFRENTEDECDVVLDYFEEEKTQMQIT